MLDRLANLLVRYSTAVRPGERVCLSGPSLAESLLVALYREVLLAGGNPVVVMTPLACLELLLRHGDAGQLGFVSPLEAFEVETADVSIQVVAADRSQPAAGLDPSQLGPYQSVRRPLVERFLRRAAERSLRWVATQFPCAAAAEPAGMTLAEFEAFVWTAAFLDRPDPVAAWLAQSQRQARLADYLGRTCELHFVTAAGTDLRVGVAGRTWVNGDGRQNLPDGEVYTGPVEDATEGTLCLDVPALLGGRAIEGVRLSFRAGRVVDASATLGEDVLHRVLAQDAGAGGLGEVALGCNYAVTRPTRNALLDEKIGGTFHVALGASYPESGGRNVSVLHWDLVGDLRQGGYVEADGVVINRDGRFLNADWPQP
jgi:aminopeptidase